MLSGFFRIILLVSSESRTKTQVQKPKDVCLCYVWDTLRREVLSQIQYGLQNTGEAIWSFSFLASLFPTSLSFSSHFEFTECEGTGFLSRSSWIERAWSNRPHHRYGVPKTEKGLEVHRQWDSKTFGAEAERKEIYRAEVSFRCPSLAKEFQIPPDF